MGMIYIGIDNGVSGSVAAIKNNGIVIDFFLTPIKSELNYTKVKKNISRLDYAEFESNIRRIYMDYKNIKVIIERPMVNPGRFAATISAVRCLEATLIVLENIGIPYLYTDSKLWQTELLPSGIKGSDNLKKASMDIGCRLFPQYSKIIQKHKDADGLLIAEWARRKRV